jgi:error-prone DNA polymerase
MGRRGSDLAAAARAAGAGEGSTGTGSTGTTDEQVRRVLVHASGFRQSPYADIKPQGVSADETRRSAAAEAERRAQEQATKAAQQAEKKADAPSKLWHSSPGSSGW